MTLSIKETKSKSSVSFKLDVTGKCQGIESFIVKLNLPPNLRSSLGAASCFSRALLENGYLQSRPQPEAVLSPVSYRSSLRRRQRKRLLLASRSMRWLNDRLLSFLGPLNFVLLLL